MRLVTSTFAVLAGLAAACASAPAPAPSPPPSPSAPAAPSAPAPAAALPSTYPGTPPTRTEAFAESLHGVTLTDPYRWMEAGGAALTAFLDAQNHFARGVLAPIPGRDALREALHRASTGVTRVWIVGQGGKRVFLEKRGPDEDLWKVYVRDGWKGADRLLVDPVARASGEQHFAVDYSYPSPDGKYLAYGISASGSEDSVIEILDVDTGKQLAEKIDRAQYAGIRWTPDSRSFYYWRRAKPAPGATAADFFRNSRIYRHALGGDPEKDPAVFGPGVAGVDLPDTYFSDVLGAPTNTWVAVVASAGTSGTGRLFAARTRDLGRAKAPWRPLVGEDADVMQAVLHGDDVYLMTYDGAPNYRVERIDLRAAKVARTVVVPEGKAVVDGIIGAADALYVHFMQDGLSRIARFDYKTRQLVDVPLPFAGTLASVDAAADRPGVRFALASWTRAPEWFAFDPKTGKTENLGLVEPWPVDYSHIVADEVEATSADGTKVPCSVLHRKDLVKDGQAPTLVHAYGSYGSSMDAYFSPSTLTWVDQGGVYVVAHIRGGGERGKAWHQGGQKANKERGVDDFIACTQYAIDQKITSPGRVAVIGTSAGGLTSGGVLTKRPDLLAAAVVRVGLSDLMRFENTEGGPANVPEFGTVTKADDFAYMLATSPYHRVKDGAAYPAVMLTTGIHDVRVPSWQPSKMTARLQAASASGKPVILRVETDAGHGLGTTRAQSEAEYADIFAFLLWQMGVPGFQPATK